MLRIKKVLVDLFILILAFPLISFSETFKRSIDNKIEINPDGTALITRVENVPSPDLARVYSMHYKDLVKDKKLFNSFVSEIAKEYYFLYGTAPQFTCREKEVKEDGKSFTSTIRMKAAGLIKKENSNLTFSRKRIVDEKGQISEKVFLKYFENELDSKYFESAFLGSEKNSLATKRSTEVVLPEGSKLQEVNLTADAKIVASAEGRLPFTLAAHLYNVAGPFVKITSSLRGEVNASVGSSNQVGYAVKGGLKAEGGVQMAGWLKDLCDSIPSVSYTFFDWSPTLKTGTYTF